MKKIIISGSQNCKELVSRLIKRINKEQISLQQIKIQGNTYLESAKELIKRVLQGCLGILVTQQHIKATVVLNKIKGIYACAIHNQYEAVMCREVFFYKKHNNLNIMILGSDVIGEQLIIRCIKKYSMQQFDDSEKSSHKLRVGMITKLQENLN